MSEPEYLSYEHYPLNQAESDKEEADDKHYKVTTINGTYATVNGAQVADMVHRNVYKMSLSELIQWIRDTEEVAEDIVDIQQME